MLADAVGTLISDANLYQRVCVRRGKTKHLGNSVTCRSTQLAVTGAVLLL